MSITSEKHFVRIAEDLDNDKRFWIEDLLSIRNKQRRVVDFKLNNIQRQMCADSTNSDIYVKPRQVGASEYFIADITLDTVLRPGTTSIIVAYEEEATKRLLAKSDFFYMSDKLQKMPYYPTRNHDSEDKKTFHWYKNKDNKHAGQYAPPSTLYIASARSFVIARGDAYHNIIADEFAYWPYPEKLFELLGGRTPDSKLRILSTPNGEDNQFFEMYYTAIMKALTGDNVYTAHFYSWMMHEEYSIGPDDIQALAKDKISPLVGIDSDELALIANGCTENQIRWRRFKMAEMAQMHITGETRILFSQEFPENDQTCFHSYGDMAYPADVLNDKLKECRPALRRHLSASIWYEPEQNGKYLIAVDPGMGRQSMTAITVWQFFTDEGGHDVARHCATIHGLYTPEQTKPLVWELGKFYNWALLAPENNIGTLVILLKDYPVKYLLKDPVSGRPSMTFGWVTTNKSKPIMIDELRMMLPRMQIHDARILKEIRNMRVDPTREDRVLSTGLDDLHDSACIAMMCRSTRQARKGFAFSYSRKT